MPDHRIMLTENNETFETLEDILPTDKNLNILFIAKVPTPDSVASGHYFQGRQGQLFWKKLYQYGLLDTPMGEKEDDQLLRYNYGMIDIIKRPRYYRDEPSAAEYRTGARRAINIINTYNPKVIVFVYKKVLDKILKYYFELELMTTYGFNSHLEHLWNTKVFVFPVPGTPVNGQDAKRYLKELRDYAYKNFDYLNASDENSAEL